MTTIHTHESWSNILARILARFNDLPPAKLFLINTAVLTVSIVFLGLAFFVQQHDSLPTAFAGYRRGVAVAMGNSVMTVDSVGTTQGSGIFAAPSSMHYLVVELGLKNISDKPINIAPSTDIYVKDPTGKVSFLTPLDLRQPLRGGVLLPGDQIKGQLSFLVPAHGKQTMYIDSFWSGRVVPFVVQ